MRLQRREKSGSELYRTHTRVSLLQSTVVTRKSSFLTACQHRTYTRVCRTDTKIDSKPFVFAPYRHVKITVQTQRPSVVTRELFRTDTIIARSDTKFCRTHTIKIPYGHESLKLCNLNSYTKIKPKSAGKYVSRYLLTTTTSRPYRHKRVRKANRDEY